MKRISVMILALSGLALAGCGGGGGGSPDTQPPEATRLASYIGLWSEGCDGHGLGTLEVGRTSADTINFTAKTQYFANSGCTGAVVGTETSSANVTMVYTSAVDASVVLTPGSASVTRKIDLVTARRAQSTTSVTGSGVVRSTRNGQPEWCIAFADSSTVCIEDAGIEPAIGPISAGLYATGNEMFILVPNSGVYEVDMRLTK